MIVKLKALSEVETGEKTTFVPTIEYTSAGQLAIKVKGLGDQYSADGEGVPILLEVFEGRVLLRVWSDINKEDPTHVIDLSGAREDARLDMD